MNCTEHVIIVSGQPIPNLIPAMAGQPDMVHLLVSEKMERQAARLRHLLRVRGIACREHSIDPYNMVRLNPSATHFLKERRPAL